MIKVTRMICQPARMIILKNVHHPRIIASLPSDTANKFHLAQSVPVHVGLCNLYSCILHTRVRLGLPPDLCLFFLPDLLRNSAKMGRYGPGILGVLRSSDVGNRS